MLPYGYVYLLRSGTFYKIGHSKTPRKRLKQLRTGSPFSIVVVHQLRTVFYREIEKQLHLRFHDKRGSGEWFTLSEEDVEYIQSLNSSGQSPEEVREREEAEAQFYADLEAKEQAERDRKLAVLSSGVASGAGLCLSFAE